MTRRRLIWQVSLLLLSVTLVAFMLWPRLTPAPKLGVLNDRLTPCPDRPNCVCSQDQTADHRIDPLPIVGSATQSLTAIEDILQRMPRVRITQKDERYLRAEVRSAFIGFVDDVEFVVDRQEDVIHCRSASRIGYSDLGVNRSRIELIRKAYLASNEDSVSPL